MSISDIENFTPFYNMRDTLSNHIRSRFEKHFQAADKARAKIQTKEALSQHISNIRKNFIESLGGIPYDKDLPLNSRTTGIIEEDNLIIEKVIFETRPKVYMTANLYMPKKRKEPCGAVLFQVGHSNVGKLAKRYQCVSPCYSLRRSYCFAY